ncbi:unnamed protein product [Acanthoscelides obtectus]|uniref:Uncharacterized protein n=1 Tax=Acanthoscelides obtectus TaxID=200917 RepID=A0A9P0KCK6_ACAOB|nr:unnamed protein product [Acanthoscelides obtectus]CAK1675306.1 hypothetical protein AOBTE_LOCUS30120 [Acanthoscelides obtectus]
MCGTKAKRSTLISTTRGVRADTNREGTRKEVLVDIRKEVEVGTSKADTSKEETTGDTAVAEVTQEEMTVTTTTAITITTTTMMVAIITIHPAMSMDLYSTK